MCQSEQESDSENERMGEHWWLPSLLPWVLYVLVIIVNN